MSLIVIWEICQFFSSLVVAALSHPHMHSVNRSAAENGFVYNIFSISTLANVTFDFFFRIFSLFIYSLLFALEAHENNHEERVESNEDWTSK